MGKTSSVSGGACTAMVLESPRGALVARRRAVPTPGPGQVLLEVAACGVCRTDLHLLDAELPDIGRSRDKPGNGDGLDPRRCGPPNSRLPRLARTR